MANSVMPMPVTCCDRPSGTVSSACSSPKAAPVSAATSDAGPQARAEIDRQPAGHGAGGEDALDAEVEHARALADQRAEHAEDQRRRDAERRRPEARREQDVENAVHVRQSRRARPESA